MGGTVDRRLGVLEDAFGDQLRTLDPPDGDRLARELFRKAYSRLSLVEMNVMDELLEAYGSRPGLSPAEVGRELTEAQRAMENEWRKVVTTVAREGIDADDALRPERREVLKRDILLAVANAPFYRRSTDGAT